MKWLNKLYKFLLMHFRRSFQPTGQVLRLLLGLAVLFSAGGGSAIAQPAGTALVGLSIAGPADLNVLAAQGFRGYGEIVASSGETIVLLSADARQQAWLAEQGYETMLLDGQESPGAYFLLQGDAQQLRLAGDQARLLWTDGQQAVALANPDQGERFADLGLLWRPLRQAPLLPVSIASALAAPQAVTPSPLVQQMISQVSSTALYNYVGGLSGEWAVTIDGSPYILATRYSRTDQAIKKATRYVYEYFQSLSLATMYDYYYLSGVEKRNVIAQQVGVGQPGRILMLTAHLDSYSTDSDPYTLAPGADDNASGSAALMHIASILRNYQFDCTIRYALFTGEEQGLIGSYAYAQKMYNAGTNIAGVLNLDMIGYNTPGSYRSLELHTRLSNAADLQIANLFVDVVSAYQLNLYPYVLQDGESFSDHSSFWTFGYPAILAIEDWDDHTPYYHKKGDRLSTLDMSYYAEFTRAALATLAHMGCLRQGQVAGQVTDASNGLPIANATVTASLDGGGSWQTSTSGTGAYELTLTPGVYSLTSAAPYYQTQTHTGVTVSASSSTTENFAQTPCTYFSQVDFSFTPVEPGVGQSVQFVGSAVGVSPQFLWNFDDGSYGSGATITHAFAASRAYNVAMAIANACDMLPIYRYILVGMTEKIYFPLVGKP
jgi:hypothetical protein